MGWLAKYAVITRVLEFTARAEILSDESAAERMPKCQGRTVIGETIVNPRQSFSLQTIYFACLLPTSFKFVLSISSSPPSSSPSLNMLSARPMQLVALHVPDHIPSPSLKLAHIPPTDSDNSDNYQSSPPTTPDRDYHQNFTSPSSNNLLTVPETDRNGRLATPKPGVSLPHHF